MDTLLDPCNFAGLEHPSSTTDSGGVDAAVDISDKPGKNAQ
jgi:hypothetical protein